MSGAIPLSRVISLPSSTRQLIFQAAAINSGLRSISLQSRSFSATQSQDQAQNDASIPLTTSSVSDTEVSHFKALASSWWDPHGSSRLLHLMNPLRHKFIRQCLASHGDDTSGKLQYLDIGCGGGIFAESAARLPHTQSVTAIDPTPEVIAVARRHQRQDPLLLEHGRLKYENTAVENLNQPSTLEGGYDIVSLFEVIEHIRTPSPFLQTCLKHVKPGGWLVGSTIARTSASWFTTKVMAEDVLRIVPKGTHTWDQYIQPSELRNWARSQQDLDVDFQGWQVMGVIYVPGLGWKEVQNSEEWGNYFFGIRRKKVEE